MYWSWLGIFKRISKKIWLWKVSLNIADILISTILQCSSSAIWKPFLTLCISAVGDLTREVFRLKLTWEACLLPEIPSKSCKFRGFLLPKKFVSSLRVRGSSPEEGLGRVPEEPVPPGHVGRARLLTQLEVGLYEYGKYWCGTEH